MQLINHQQPALYISSTFFPSNSKSSSIFIATLQTSINISSTKNSRLSNLLSVPSTNPNFTHGAFGVALTIGFTLSFGLERVYRVAFIWRRSSRAERVRLSNGLKETSIVRTYLIRWVDISLVTLSGILIDCYW